ncbi:hypothetical protein EDB80DRAFT_712252 [Ilyonectria destructans]|nr:hypothetical protein EDB80DRAFT_712252 [Ilyonectria destructans]
MNLLGPLPPLTMPLGCVFFLFYPLPFFASSAAPGLVVAGRRSTHAASRTRWSQRCGWCGVVRAWWLELVRGMVRPCTVPRQYLGELACVVCQRGTRGGMGPCPSPGED